VRVRTFSERNFLHMRHLLTPLRLRFFAAAAERTIGRAAGPPLDELIGHSPREEPGRRCAGSGRVLDIGVMAVPC